jgi:hypothetical protein
VDVAEVGNSIGSHVAKWLRASRSTESASGAVEREDLAF